MERCWRKQAGFARCEEVSSVVLNVPDRLQRNDHSCGTAAARAIFEYFGVPWKSPSAAGIPSPIDGTDPRMLESLFRGAGFTVEAGQSRLSTLRHHVREGRPALVVIQQEGGGHWCVFKGHDRGKVVLMDPSEGTVKMPAAEFDGIWWDVDRHAIDYRRWAVVVGQ